MTKAQAKILTLEAENAALKKARDDAFQKGYACVLNHFAVPLVQKQQAQQEMLVDLMRVIIHSSKDAP